MASPRTHASLDGVEVLSPADGEKFDNPLWRWATNSERRAKYVVLPRNADEVSKAILFANANNLEVATKGGGHSVSGASSTEGGLVIDLLYMNSVHVDTERRLIKVGGGALWADVDREAVKHRLATVGGTVNHTGVGGLTVGGGYGWLTGKYGLTIDLLQEAEVVLANGEIVAANKTQNDDMFWVIRGGGSNFGLVTSFTFQAFPQPNTVWSALLAFPPQKLETIFKAIEAWTKTASKNESAVIVFGCPQPAFKPAIGVNPFYNRPVEQGKNTFKALYDLEPLSDLTREMPYPDVNEMHNVLSAHGDRRQFKSVSFASVEHTRFQQIFDNYVQPVNDYPDAKPSAILVGFHPFRKTVAVSNDAAAFAGRGEWFHFIVSLQYKDPSLDEHLRTWAHEQAQYLNSREKADGMDVSRARRIYSNYGAGDSRERSRRVW